LNQHEKFPHFQPLSQSEESQDYFVEGSALLKDQKTRKPEENLPSSQSLLVAKETAQRPDGEAMEVRKEEGADPGEHQSFTSD
jgi:hypothetical protein